MAQQKKDEGNHFDCSDEKSVEAVVQKIVSTFAKVEEQEKTIEEQKKEKEELEESLDSTKEELANANFTIDEMKKQIEKKNEVIGDLKEKNGELLKIIENYRDYSERINAEKNKLQLNLVMLQVNHDVLQVKLSNEEATSLELRNKVETLQAQNEETENALEEETERCEKYRREFEETDGTSARTHDKWKKEKEIRDEQKNEVDLMRSQLIRKTVQLEIFQDNVNDEKEEKMRMETESLQNWNSKLTEIFYELTGSTPDYHKFTELTNLDSRLHFLCEFIKNSKEVGDLTDESIEDEASGPPAPPSAPAQGVIMPLPSNCWDLPNPNPESSHLGNNNGMSDRDVFGPEEQSPIISTASIGENGNNEIKVATTSIRCWKCKRIFPTWMTLCQHQKTVHIIRMGKKMAQKRVSYRKKKADRRLKITLGKKKKNADPEMKQNEKQAAAAAIPKIKMKQKDTPDGASWNIVVPSPTVPPITIGNDKIDQAEPLHNNNQRKDQSTSSSTEANQHHRPPISEVSTVNKVAAGVEQQKHGLDKRQPSPRPYYKLDPKFLCEIYGRPCRRSRHLRKRLQEKHQIKVKKMTVMNGKRRGQKSCPNKKCKRYHQGSTRSFNTIVRKLLKKLRRRTHLTRSGKSLLENIYKDSSADYLVCICGFQPVNKNAFIDHVVEKNHRKKLECDICHKIFRNLAKLRRHQEHVHDPTEHIALFESEWFAFLSEEESENHNSQTC